MEGKPTFLSDVEESPIGFSALVLHDVQNIAAWHIWKQRNNLIFEGRRPTIRDWTSKFIEEARLQAHRIKEGKKTGIS